MKALIIKKHWINKIFNEGKVWEMRSRPTRITGKIQLIESGSGTIVGEAVLINGQNKPIAPDLKHFDKHKIDDISLLKKYKYPWILQNAKRYKKPIPYNHPKGAVIWVNV